jgi:predicted enzyme related to lactoylglutathione lyase
MTGFGAYNDGVLTETTERITERTPERGGAPMFERDGFPPGVPCWIDVVQPDFDATTAFYGGLFGWTFEMRTPPEAPFRYAYARRDGLLVAGIGGATEIEPELRTWTQYVYVDSVDDAVESMVANGGTILAPAADIPESGRVATVIDPGGARVGVWQAAKLRGVQLANTDGSWNFSELRTADPERAIAFYGAVFGWECDRIDIGTDEPAWLWRLPGYGEYLAERDPEIEERQASDGAPGGFADAVAWMGPFATGTAETPRWTVTFAVADADAAWARAIELGATVVTPLFDTGYTRQGVVRDPQGAELTLSEYRPPAPG